MALSGSVQGLPLFGGIDTKSDPKFVGTDNTLVSQNTVFPGIQQAAKRYGQSVLPQTIVGGGSITTGASFGAFRDQPLVFDGQTMYSYSPALSGWLERAKLTETASTIRPVATGPGGLFNPQGVRAGDVEIHSWDDGTNIFYVVKDATSGAYLTAPAIVAPLTDVTSPCRLLTNGIYFFFFYPRLGSVRVRAGVVAQPQSGLGTEFAVVPFGGSNESFAVNVSEADSARINLAFFGGGEFLQFAKVQATAFPVFVSSRVNASVTSADGRIVEVHDAITSGTYAGECYAVLAATSAPFMRVYRIASRVGFAQDLPVAAPTWTYTAQSFPSVGTTTGYPVSSILIGDRIRIYHSLVYTNPALVMSGVTASVRLNRTVYLEVTVDPNDGNVSLSIPDAVTNYVDGVTLATTMAWKDNTPLALVSTPQYRGNLGLPTGQATYFIMSGTDCRLGLRLLGNQAADVGPLLPALFLNPDGTYQFDVPVASVLDTNSLGNIYAELSISTIYAETASPSTVRILPFGTSAVITCGNTYSYDGASVVEDGFWQFPGGISTTVSATGGNLAAGASYTFQFTFEWTDVEGNLHISSPSFPVVVTTPGTGSDPATCSVSFAVPNLFTTLRTGVLLGVYRAVQNSSVPLYREQSIPLNLTQPDTVGVSTMSDNILLAQYPLYSEGGLGELENEPAPAFRFVTATKNRLFGIPQDNPYQLWYSKPLVTGRPAQWSSAFVIQIETAGGEPTALSYLDVQAIVFKKERVYYLPGDGPGVTGQPANGFGPLQLISTVTGCSQPATVLPTSVGLFFKSSTTMAVLNRSLSLDQKVGLPVQGLNYLTLQGGAVVPEQNQLRWVSKEGTGLIYDFLMDRWSTFTNYDGVGCLTTSTGLFMRATDTGLVWYEDPTTYLDNGAPIPMKIGTAWVKPGGQSQGFMAVWQAMLLGEYRSTHNLRVDIYYDYSEAPQFSLTWNPQGALNVSVYGSESPYGSTPYYGSTTPFPVAYQVRITPPRQVCQAIRFVVMDTGITGESCRLNEIELQLGNMGGLNRTIAKQTI